MVAIDFTGSNGHPDTPGSLHYRKGSTPNQYQQAIHAVGSILAPYDSDQKYPIWGFGGSMNSTVSHCFPLTFSSSQIEVQGVDGLLKAYGNAFTKVSLSGPTYFAEIINTATAIASAPYAKDFQHYSILLILTDGVINDMERTLAAIKSASERPLSIIIVGVGEADFSQMENLDGDDDAKKKGAKRDVVQFVPFRKLNGNLQQLTQQTLAEVPQQVLSFMKTHKISPLQPRTAKQELYVPQQAVPIGGYQQAIPVQMPLGK